MKLNGADTDLHRQFKGIITRFKTPWKIWPFLAIVIIVVVAFFPIIFGNRSLLGSPFAAGVMGDKPPYGLEDEGPVSNQHQLDPGASAWQDEPWTEKIAKLYGDADLPLWNSSQALGKPLAAAMQSAVFFPLKALVFLAPTPLVWNIFLLIRLTIGLVLGYAFLRLTGLQKISSLVGATIFALSGHYIFFVAEAHLNVDLVLPLVLIGFELIAQKRSKAWLWLAVAIFLMVVGGHPETALLAGAFGAIYFIYRILLERNQIGWKLGQAGLGLLVGIGSSMFLMLPFVEFMSFAYTIHGSDSNLALSHDPKQMVINLFYPYFYGWPYLPWNHQYGAWSGTRNYIGVSALFLASLSLFSFRTRYRYIPIFALLFVVAVTKQFGLLNYEWLNQIPYFSAIGYQKYLGPEVAFFGGALAAFGIDYILTDVKKFKPWILILPSALIAYTVWYLYPFSVQAPPTVIDNVRIQFILPLVLIGLAVLGSVLWWWRPALLKIIALAFASIAIIEMVVLVPNYWPKRVEPYNKPPYVSFLQEKGPQRLFATDYLLYPNTSSAFDLYDIRDLDAVFVTHYFRYIKEFVNPSVVDRYTGMAENAEKENLPTQFRDNPFFDLLNVRYLITRNQAVLDTNSSLAKQLASGVPSANVGLRTLKVNDETRPVLFEHPETTLRAVVIPKTNQTKLNFSIGIDQSAWDKEGDGVRFIVAIDGNPTPLYSRWIDPKNNQNDRVWIDGEIDLGRYRGKSLPLVFQTQAGANNMNDLAGWSRLRLSDEAVKSDSQYQLVYDKEVNIYENTEAFERAFLVGDVISRGDDDSAIQTMKTPGFDPRISAVVETSDDLSLFSKEPIDFSNVTIRSYKDQQVKIDVRAPRRSLLVLSDTYYPGWRAFVDGKETKIYQTDLALRGIVVEAGRHDVEFRYQPNSFRYGLIISFLSILIAITALRWTYLRKKVSRGLYTPN